MPAFLSKCQKITDTVTPATQLPPHPIDAHYMSLHGRETGIYVRGIDERIYGKTNQSIYKVGKTTDCLKKRTAGYTGAATYVKYFMPMENNKEKISLVEAVFKCITQNLAPYSNQELRQMPLKTIKDILNILDGEDITTLRKELNNLRDGRKRARTLASFVPSSPRNNKKIKTCLSSSLDTEQAEPVNEPQQAEQEEPVNEPQQASHVQPLQDVRRPILSEDELITMWLKKYKRTTVKGYRLCLNKFRTYCGTRHVNLRNASLDDVVQYCANVERRSVTSRPHKAMIKSFYKWAYVNRHIPNNPVALLHLPRQTPTQRKREFSEDDARKLLRCARKIKGLNHFLVIALGYYAGLKRKQISDLSTDDILEGPDNNSTRLVVTSEHGNSMLTIQGGFARELLNRAREKGPARPLFDCTAPTVGNWVKCVASECKLPHVTTELLVWAHKHRTGIDCRIF
jgi:hypothetical protein